MLDYRVVAAALFPWLFYQGREVRRVTPRLPEAPGPRTGTTGNGPSLRLLIAGDSAAAGVGAASQDEGLSGSLLKALRDDFTVYWRVDARTGSKTVDLLRRLESADAASYDVAVLSLGVNDVTGGTRSHDFVARQKSLIEMLKLRFGVRLVVLTGLPPMHLFPALPQPLRWCLGERAMAFTCLLETVASGDPDCRLVTPHLPEDIDYMASDGFHPGPKAYAAWGREVAAVIRAQLR